MIYYPTKQIEIINPDKEWYKNTIYKLINITKFVSSKYPRSKVKRKLQKEYAYAIMEMLNCNNDNDIKSYYEDIIDMIISIENEKEFVIALCHAIREIGIDYIHIIGDIFDRGPRPDLIIEELMKYEHVDIQWGNHDISWMGAASGNKSLIANVIRIALSYNSFDLLEDGYGINLRPLSDFAREIYKDDPCDSFVPHILDENQYDIVDKELTAKMHKAITIIQLKLDGQLIEKHPEYHMNHLQWLKNTDFNRYIVYYDNKDYKLNDTFFPTIDVSNPLKLTKEEESLMNTLQSSFLRSERLQKHIQYIYAHGNMYKIFNGNLLFHGCIPLNVDGTFRSVKVHDKVVSGKELLDELEKVINNAYFHHEYVDDMWFLWCSPDSPVFGKSKLSVFEKYFIDDKSISKEEYDYYYQFIENEEVALYILRNFGLDNKKSHIINGHVPVKIKDGEKPIKANGKVYVIDGGISKAYQSKTGNAGYTLIYDSYSLKLARHRPYDREAIFGLLCLTPEVKVIESHDRLKNKDCDMGIELYERINDLQALLKEFQNGKIKEKYIHK